MNDVWLRQFAMLQLEMVLQNEWTKHSTDRLWAALYSVQRMDSGPMPDDFGQVISRAIRLDTEAA
jgi:hypothetical protein